MKVTVVVVAYFGDEWLGRCLEFIQDEASEGVRLVVGDNYGNGNITALFTGRHMRLVSLDGPLPFADANNQMLVTSGFDTRYVCFLNQDTKSPAGWLLLAAEFLDRYPDVGAITPLISTYDGKDWDPNFADCARPAPALWEELNRRGETSAFYEVPVIPAPAMVVRTEVLRLVGGFDPIYGSYYEDYDLCQRIRRAGYRVGIWTGAMVAHFSGSATRTADEDRRRQRLIVRNRLIYRVRAAGTRRLNQLGREVLVELPRQLARRVLGRLASKPIGVVLGGYWDAARVLNRLISTSDDQRLWRGYLSDIDWPIGEE